MLYDVFDFIEVRAKGPCCPDLRLYPPAPHGPDALMLKTRHGIEQQLSGACSVVSYHQALSTLPLLLQAAKARNGRVLLHCSQGVSRSASLAIAYLMWKQNRSFDDTLAAVKAIRGVANPNIGFTCQACLHSFLSSCNA